MTKVIRIKHQVQYTCVIRAIILLKVYSLIVNYCIPTSTTSSEWKLLSKERQITNTEMVSLKWLTELTPRVFSLCRRFISIPKTSVTPMHQCHLSNDWWSSRITAASTSFSSPWWQNAVSSFLEYSTKLFRLLSQGFITYSKGENWDAIAEFFFKKKIVTI